MMNSEADSRFRLAKALDEKVRRIGVQLLSLYFIVLNKVSTFH